MNRSLKLDGGLSTALEGLGLNLNTSLWTGELLRSNPKAIERAHRAFVDAGAEIITFFAPAVMCFLASAAFVK